MPRAEVGSTKHLANQMKSKGLQRLRWYCQACARQMRDENGFKCHVASESHVRAMGLIGEDPRKAISEFSRQFQTDFVKLLRTGHGEKKIAVNHFYQEYIAHKEHVHMNATRWASLTEFAKHLGREGVCRVMEEEADEDTGRGGGLMISWIDNSPEALRRQDALKKRERQDRGDEEREWRGIREQIAKAKRVGHKGEGEDGSEDEDVEEGGGDETKILDRKEDEKINFTFGSKKPSPTAQPKPPSPPLTEKSESPDTATTLKTNTAIPSTTITSTPLKLTAKPTSSTTLPTSKLQNALLSAPKKNPLLSSTKKSKTSTSTGPSTSRPMSEAERIMREEIERKQRRDEGRGEAKRRRVL